MTPFQNCVQQPWPQFKMAAVTKNRNFFNCPLLLYYKSKWVQILTASYMAMSSLTYIQGFHVKILLLLNCWTKFGRDGLLVVSFQNCIHQPFQIMAITKKKNYIKFQLLIFCPLRLRNIVIVSFRLYVTLCECNFSETVWQNLFIFGRIVSHDI